MSMVEDRWGRPVDRFGKVGSRHHVVPRFVLEKWADRSGLVWAKSKHDRKEGRRNIRDLAITDFYTFLALDGQLDSSLEEILGRVETNAAAVLARLTSPLSAKTSLTPAEFVHLVEFVGFQMTRSPRRRREYELMADWYGKTMASGRLPDQLSEDELRGLEFVPHQNGHIESIGPATEAITHELMGRPLSLVTLDRPLLLIGDEAVVVNTDGDHVKHLPQCTMTEEQLQRRLTRASRRKKRREREVEQLIHIYPTQPRGVGTALEIAMPISPRTLLVFGPAGQGGGAVGRDVLRGKDAEELAVQVNNRIIRYSLDVIVGRVEDEEFRALPIPECTPLLVVCGSTGAAKDAVASTPRRVRPRRLDRHPDIAGS
ncbi:DUF4238 domain-containing protein [Nocardia harenae]|uniref:DUF4238 domain-containing protein n=1 Tax=Nocardia harenae TaxID=358707 RepID=UPI000A06E6B3|nr:DUF4238 domain-containing protein [Nocardia harenae]